MLNKEYEKVRISYEKALEIDPKSGIIFSNLSETYLRLKYFLKAIDMACKAMLHISNDHILYNKVLMRKAKALYHQDKFDECMAVLNKIKKDSNEK